MYQCSVCRHNMHGSVHTLTNNLWSVYGIARRCRSSMLQKARLTAERVRHRHMPPLLPRLGSGRNIEAPSIAALRLQVSRVKQTRACAILLHLQRLQRSTCAVRVPLPLCLCPRRTPDTPRAIAVVGDDMRAEEERTKSGSHRLQHGNHVRRAARPLQEYLAVLNPSVLIHRRRSIYVDMYTHKNVCARAHRGISKSVRQEPIAAFEGRNVPATMSC